METETTQVLIKCRIPRESPRPRAPGPPAPPTQQHRRGAEGAGARRPRTSRRTGPRSPGRSAKAQGHFGSSDLRRRCRVSSPRAIVSHTRRRDWTETPSPESSPGTRWRQKWKKKEVPASYTPSHSNVQTIKMQVSGRPETAC